MSFIYDDNNKNTKKKKNHKRSLSHTHTRLHILTLAHTSTLTLTRTHTRTIRSVHRVQLQWSLRLPRTPRNCLASIVALMAPCAAYDIIIFSHAAAARPDQKDDYPSRRVTWCCIRGVVVAGTGEKGTHRV